MCMSCETNDVEEEIHFIIFYIVLNVQGADNRFFK